VLGISTDQIPTAEAWARTLGGLSYPLLSDHWPHGQAAALYGVLRADGRAERALFVVDREGKVAYAHVSDIQVIPPLDPVLAALDKLR
jgi:peroxiredoxin